MAKHSGKGYRVGVVQNRTQLKNPKTGLWTKREGSTGQFTSVKKSGSFKGVRKES